MKYEFVISHESGDYITVEVSAGSDGLDISVLESVVDGEWRGADDMPTPLLRLALRDGRLVARRWNVSGIPETVETVGRAKGRQMLAVYDGNA